MNRSSLAAGVLAAAALAGAAQAAPVMSVNSNALSLAGNITGGNVTVLGATLTAANANQSGTFTSGNSSVGFASGVVLSTGNVTQIPGANTNTAPETLGVPNGTGSGQISTAYQPGTSVGATFDQVSLSITFQFGDGSTGGNLGVRYVFASEEYLGYVNSDFNDVFEFLLDGVNIALLPSTSTPVSINSVNPNANGSRFINNVINTNGYAVAGRDFQFDGLTTLLTASGLGLSAGTHTMTFRIRDVSDGELDSAVFLQAGSFSTETPPEVPEPGSLALAGVALAAVFASRRRPA